MSNNLKECIEIGLREDSNIIDITNFRRTSIKKQLGGKYNRWVIDTIFFTSSIFDFDTPMIELSKLLDEETNKKVVKLKWFIISECIESLICDKPERFNTLLHYICESKEEATRINELCCKMFAVEVDKLKVFLKVFYEDRYDTIPYLYYHFEIFNSDPNEGLQYDLCVYVERNYVPDSDDGIIPIDYLYTYTDI